jgi:hypothetical protein
VNCAHDSLAFLRLFQKQAQSPKRKFNRISVFHPEYVDLPNSTFWRRVSILRQRATSHLDEPQISGIKRKLSPLNNERYNPYWTIPITTYLKEMGQFMNRKESGPWLQIMTLLVLDIGARADADLAHPF